jgi:hypothetical protein
MGAYAEIWVGDLFVTSSKNFVHGAIMSLFRSADRNVRSSDDPIVPRHLAESRRDVDPDNMEFQFLYYETSAFVVRERLELEGYTLGNARQLFAEWRDLELQQRERYRQKVPEFEETQERLRHLTADKWIEYVRWINEGRPTYNDKDERSHSFVEELLNSNDGNERWYGYDCPDPLLLLRLALEACDRAGTVHYDLTDLADQGYVGIEEDPAATGFDASVGRTVILTEGRTDAAILGGAMELLHPHLAGAFSFMDFTDVRGGAGQLANLVRAFAAAGIVNRVVAVFDNDAAAVAAMKAVRRETLPQHILMMRLPDLPALQAYPTLGPTGLSVMDINGMAASLELYLGDDILRNADGALPPVQWTGYEHSVGVYQGELMEKARVNALFTEKLARARADRVFRDQGDWAGLQLILSKILAAFHRMDGEILSKQLRQYFTEG